MRKEIYYITDDGAIFLSPNKAKQHEVVIWVTSHLDALQDILQPRSSRDCYR